MPKRAKTQFVPIEISARHIHISQKDLEVLFGKGYLLHRLRKLSQANEFAARETVDIAFGSQIIKKVRIVGPPRQATQVELSLTDAFYLGIRAPLRLSGDIQGTPGITLISPKRKLGIKKGVIVAKRHLHCSPQEAQKLGLKKGMEISVKVKGERGLIFDNVIVRIKEGFHLAVHLDTDEGNAAGIVKKGKGVIIKCRKN
ncbi:phosphate propanoyltransferase [bacterium]|nr:phosphate propanoyltransferase [bacterium]